MDGADPSPPVVVEGPERVPPAEPDVANTTGEHLYAVRSSDRDAGGIEDAGAVGLLTGSRELDVLGRRRRQVEEGVFGRYTVVARSVASNINVERTASLERVTGEPPEIMIERASRPD